ncbi:serine/threonine-protein kinase [Massilia sp. W12]|uniref:serine/threonine protein kinase n=1 Tax=Massilia sp. W12 TaxID=3126507 RepID=UPI0030D05362
MKTEEIFASTVQVPRDSGTENCLPIGTRLADFEITGILGEGGFGIVYLAFDHSLQRTVAIKEYMPGTLASRVADGGVAVRAERHKATFEAGLKSFINEARLLAQFDHPSLVKVYRFWEQNRTAYMAMRYYDGKTLKEIVNTRPEMVTEAWLKFIFKQILEALDTLYKAKILHRDVSPDNIIVQKNGDAVLLDFGSARQIIGDMTQGLTVILKPGYAPVEQYADDATLRQGPWTDIYALAAVMYFAINKTPPPTSVARVVKDSLIPLQQGQHAGFSEKFLQAVDIGLAIQPEDRPQSMDEFRRLLGIPAFISARSSRSSRSSAANPGASQNGETRQRNHGPRTQGKVKPKAEEEEGENIKRGRSRPGLIIFALGLALMLGAGLYFSKRQSEPAPVVNNPPQPASAPLAQVSTPTPSPGVTPTPAATPAASQAANASATSGSPPQSNPAGETEEWESLKTETSPDKLNAFLQKYPDGKFAEAAKSRLAELSKTGEPAPAKVNVRLSIKPWGDVYVDGTYRGASPPKKALSLEEGKHKVTIKNGGFPDYSTEIVVSKKKGLVIEHEFK